MDTLRTPPRTGLPLAALLLLAGACVDNPAASVDPPVHGHAVSCTADIRAEAVTCGTPGTAANAGRWDLMGGNGTYLSVLPSRVAYNEASHTLNVWIAVRNLTAQPLGTADGAVPTRLRVFIPSGPTLTGGTGTVELVNPDGTAGLQSRSRPYFDYPGMIEPGTATPSRWWAFRVSPAAEAFEFQLLVDAQLPVPDGVLRWVPVYSTDAELRSAWRTGGDTVFAAGGSYVMRSVDGGVTWQSHRLAGTILRIWGPGAGTLYLAGIDELGRGVIQRSTLGRWTEWEQVAVRERAIRGLWGSGPSDVYAVADPHSVLHSADGTTWAETELPPDPHAYSRLLRGVWGSGPNDVYVAGWDAAPGPLVGVVAHSVDGGRSWTERPVVCAGDARVLAVWGLDAGHVWAVGECSTGTGRHGLILHSTDQGQTWTETTVPGTPLHGIWGTSPARLYAVGEGPRVAAFNGSTWVPGWTWSEEPGFGAVEGLTDGTVLAFSWRGTVLRGVR